MWTGEDEGGKKYIPRNTRAAVQSDTAPSAEHVTVPLLQCPANDLRVLHA